jgi:hypothetical protein
VHVVYQKPAKINLVFRLHLAYYNTELTEARRRCRLRDPQCKALGCRAFPKGQSSHIQARLRPEIPAIISNHSIFPVITHAGRVKELDQSIE